LADYLAVRDRAVRLIAAEDPYAAILISMHTYNLLTEHADRSTIAPAQLPLLDTFLAQQKALQQELLRHIANNPQFAGRQASESAILDHFRLLQATDNLSLLTCVDFRAPAHLLHPLPVRGGESRRVDVRAVGPRHFVLHPYPFADPSLTFQFPARHVGGKVFSTSADLQERYSAAPVEVLSVVVCAN
jgi:hypothetical protein